MSGLIPVFEIVYFICTILLSIYGLNSLALTLIYFFTRRPVERNQASAGEWPSVTVQLPIYNERHVVERLIAAAAHLDYPAEKLQIQVLDDSTDKTRFLARRAVARWREAGLDIEYLHRTKRVGFKAGALAAGLARAKGELVAVFDSDFLPSSDFLRRTVPHFSDPKVGCIQARWTHLNADYSSLTRAQAIGIDGHFLIEQTARSRIGLFLNFNGTAGIWRAECIRQAGGWQQDTLTEDLDLSYRAQLAGWRFLILPEVGVPAELPVQVDALKCQQFRWAKGNTQTIFKLLIPILRSPYHPIVKLESLIHLTGYMIHPLMLLILFLTPCLAAHRSTLLKFPAFFMTASMGPPLMYLTSQLVQERKDFRRLMSLPVLMVLGIGLSVNNTRAILEAALGIESSFRRTPKFAILNSGDRWERSFYSLPTDRYTWVELGLGLFSLGASFLLARQGWRGWPGLVFYSLGYGYVAGLSLLQAWQRRRFLRQSVSSMVGF